MIIKNGPLVTLLIKYHVISLSALIKLNGEKSSNKINPFHFMLWPYHKIAHCIASSFFAHLLFFKCHPSLYVPSLLSIHLTMIVVLNLCAKIYVYVIQFSRFQGYFEYSRNPSRDPKWKGPVPQKGDLPMT